MLQHWVYDFRTIGINGKIITKIKRNQMKIGCDMPNFKITFTDHCFRGPCGHGNEKHLKVDLEERVKTIYLFVKRHIKCFTVPRRLIFEMLVLRGN